MGRVHIRVGTRAFRREMAELLERVDAGDVVELVVDDRRKHKQIRAVLAAPDKELI